MLYHFPNFVLKAETLARYTQNCWSLGQSKELMVQLLGSNLFLATELIFQS